MFLSVWLSWSSLQVEHCYHHFRVGNWGPKYVSKLIKVAWYNILYFPKIAATKPHIPHTPLQCDLAVSLCPLPFILGNLVTILTNTVWQKWQTWYCFTSKARSQKAMQFLPCCLEMLSLGKARYHTRSPPTLRGHI